MIDTDGKFYLGRIFDTEIHDTTDEKLLYDPDDLTTHAVVVGMTGSGKTGLCIDMLEEAALLDIPALMIDPKGDITNALLHFPDLLPSDFKPWVNAEEARREDKSLDEVAEKVANLWRNGLASWDIEPDRLQALKDGPQFAIYTPGSDAGLPVSIMASLEVPKIPWEGNKELLREQISGTVTALLGLTGMKDIDPVQSREHILMANIFENAWSQGKDLDLGELIMQIQNPPFDKLGYFDVTTFYPDKDRFGLAMKLNSLVASPAFESWIEGEPLDIENMLYEADGRPRHTIFYIAHLNDAERMFFVTLLYAAVETWMRRKSGTGSLRALVYFDEIFGYLPPIGNPPSKEPMLRLLKQARAFGVGLVLASQNPVDIDYKALSNAGTWFIGKLATEQDKNRLLDGLSSATGGGLDRGEYDDLISSLGKRVFLLRNVHEKHAVLFQTRWAMNYLAGPVTRTQIPALNELAGVAARGGAAAKREPQAPTRRFTAEEVVPAAVAPPPEPEQELPGTLTRPAMPSGVEEFFLPHNLTLAEGARERGRSIPAGAKTLGLIYQPALIAQAGVRFLNRKYDVDVEKQVAAYADVLDGRRVSRWEDQQTAAIERRSFDRAPVPDSRFSGLEKPLSDGRAMRSMKNDFTDWIYNDITVPIRTNEQLGIYAGPDVSDETFDRLCMDAAEDQQEAEVDKLEDRYRKKIDTIQKRLAREERELREDEAELTRRKQEEMTTYAETIFSFFSGRRRSISSSLSKRSQSARAKEDIEESVEEIEALKNEIADLEEELDRELDEIEEKWREIAEDVSEIQMSPFKKYIDVEMFGVGWVPYYLIQIGDAIEEYPAFAFTE